MKSSLIKKTSKSIVLGLAILSLGACGKNMHIPVGNEPAVKTADPNAKVDPNAKKVDPSGNGTDAGQISGFKSDTLGPISKWDLAKSANNVTENLRYLGSSSEVSEDGNIKINRDVILLTRALIAVPAADQIKSIDGFKLTLKGVTIVVPKKKENAKEGEDDYLKNEVCVGNGKQTSGAVCVDLNSLVTKSIGKLEDGSTVNSIDKLEIDLLKALTPEGASEAAAKANIIKWLGENTLEFSKNGYRKVLVWMKNSVNVEEGSLVLDVKLNDIKAAVTSVPSAADLVNGADDLTPADALSKSKEIKVSEISEESAEDADQKTAEEKKIADDEAAKKIEEAKKAAEVLKKAQDEQVAADKKAAEEAAKKLADEAAKKLADEAAKKAAEQPAANVDASQNAAAATQTQATTETAASGQQAAATTEVKN